ncbi:MAG: hypothetical protein ACE5E9_11910 [Nitrospinaceae bacterium]
MKISINGQEDNRSYEGETLGEVLDGILRTQSGKENVICKVRINEKEVAPDSLPVRRTPVSQIDTLEAEIYSLIDILGKNLTNAENYLEKLIPGIEKASELFRMGSEQEANKFFLNIIDGIDWFSQVVDSLVKAVDISSETRFFQGPSLREKQDQLVELTGQMLDANKNKDWVLLADLLEYEIVPFYEEWKDLLPEIQQQVVKKFG